MTGAPRPGRLPAARQPRQKEASPAAPGVVDVRLVGDPDAVGAACELLATLAAGHAWHPKTRTASRHGGGQIRQYGNLIVLTEPETR